MASILHDIGIRIDFVFAFIMTLTNREVITWIRFVSDNRAINLGHSNDLLSSSISGETDTSAGSVLPTMTLSDELKDAMWALPRGSARLKTPRYFGVFPHASNMLKTNNAP
jgi:hypothetical protein